MYPTSAAVRQDCIRSVVLCSYWRVPHLWCGQNLRHKTCGCKCKDGLVYYGWYIYYYKKCPYITVHISAIYGHVMDMRTQRQHTAEIWGMVG